MTSKLLLNLTFAILLFIPCVVNAQNSLDDIIGDITLLHEGRPHGVPSGFDWAIKPRVGALTPPEGWTAAIAWGQLYEWIEGNPAKNTRVAIKDLEMYYLSKKDNKWYLLQKSSSVDGAAYVEDFAGDVNKPADKRYEPDGTLSVTCGGGYNFHFWSKTGRVKVPLNDVAACFVTVQAKVIMADPKGVDDRSIAKYVLGVGGDWWLSMTAVWDQWKTNADMGIGRFRFVTPEWKSYNLITQPVDSIRKNPPPFKQTAVNVIPNTRNEFFRLEQNYPNPFKSDTEIKFALTKPDFVRLSVLDVNGKLVQHVYADFFDAGIHSYTWDASNLPSGIYAIKLDSNNSSKTMKCVLMR